MKSAVGSALALTEKVCVVREGSVTGLFRSLQRGDRQAIEPLWKRLGVELRRFAGERLSRGVVDPSFDEDDVVLSVFGEFCRGVEAGKFPNVNDRAALWGLLSTIIVRNINDRRKARQAQKRSAKMLPESALAKVAASSDQPDITVLFEDELRHFVEALNDPLLEATAILLLQGRSTKEIAAMMGLTQRSVQRMIAGIRAEWQTVWDAQVEPDELTK